MSSKSPTNAMMLCDVREFDIENKGYLTQHEVKCYLSCALGFRPRRSELGTVMSDDGRCEYEAAEAMVKKCAPNDEEFLKQIFDAMDLEQRGYLTVESTLRVFETCCPSIKSDVIRATFQELDLAKTGMISYQQFRWIMGASRQRRRVLDAPSHFTFFSASNHLSAPYGGMSLRRSSFGSVDRGPATP